MPDASNNNTSRLAWLEQAFGLSSFDLDLILIALAPELDRRYERVYAYLQDHVSRRWPTVDLALNLLCPDAAARIERRSHFDSEAPLIRFGLIHLLPEAGQAYSSLLASAIKVDEQIVRFLLHQDGLDARISPFCQIIFSPFLLDDLPLTDEIRQALPGLASQAWTDRQPLCLYFYGPAGIGKRQAAAALALEIGTSLLAVDLAQALNAGLDFALLLRLVFRHAWFQELVLYLDGLETLLADGMEVPYQQLLDALAEDGGITIITGSRPWILASSTPIHRISVPFPMPDYAQRRNCWQSNLENSGISLSPSDLDALAGRFRLTPGQIAAAVASACSQALWRGAAGCPAGQPEDAGQAAEGELPTRDELFAAARAQSGHELAALARKIEPVYTWDDIVLPGDTMIQLREICQRVAHRQRVLGEWGFGRKLSKGKGVTALFSGPSGTGKTMAAEIMANALKMDLYKIDLSGVVSKYIGETEKNLERIFAAAENSNAILFFDEADALFGKRSEVRDSHDRYANIEISYLLQKMEEYVSIAILATNLRQNLDESFVRRLAFTVHFPFPDEASRRRIWQGIWPTAIPLEPGLDFDSLACQYRLSGGNIKNIALAAAFLAAEDGGRIGMAHLIQAVRREYQKMGKTLGANGLEPDSGEVPG